jgi:cell division protein ZapA (FtsZ GTPase activity inhibitor)
MSEKSIKVEIAGALFSLKVADEDEDNIREAVELINERISDFEKNFSVCDKKEVLSMVLLQLVSQLYKKARLSEQELSHLKELFTDVALMLNLHQQAIQRIDTSGQ